MIGVGVGREADAEAAAAALVDRAKEAPHPLVVAVPALLDRHPAAVGEHEGGDVDRIGEAMLAEPRAGLAVDRAAGIGAERLDPPHRLPEPLVRRGLHRFADPARELPGERAGHRAEIGRRACRCRAAAPRRAPSSRRRSAGRAAPGSRIRSRARSTWHCRVSALLRSARAGASARGGGRRCSPRGMHALSASIAMTIPLRIGEA